MGHGFSGTLGLFKKLRQFKTHLALVGLRAQ
jgi:hypothetical protein